MSEICNLTIQFSPLKINIKVLMQSLPTPQRGTMDANELNRVHTQNILHTTQNLRYLNYKFISRPL